MPVPQNTGIMDNNKENVILCHNWPFYVPKLPHKYNWVYLGGSTLRDLLIQVEYNKKGRRDPVKSEHDRLIEVNAL